MSSPKDIAAKTGLTEKDVDECIAQFQSFDLDGNGSITEDELAEILKNLGETVDKKKLQALIAEVDEDNSGSVEFDEFLHIFKKIKSGDAGAASRGFGGVVTKQAQVIKIQGAVGQHSFSEEEKEAFCEHINDSLKTDPDIGSRLPIKIDSMDLFSAVSDGILLCKLINHSVPKTIDERVINKGAKLNAFKITENQNLCINSAKAIGCSVVNIGHGDLTEGKAHLVLGLLWQIIKIGLLKSINLNNHPGLVRLLEEGETINDLLKLPPDQLLLRWVNFHLREAGSSRRIKNFGGDIKDSEAYTVLLHQIAPKNAGVDTQALAETDATKRAEHVLRNADKIGCKKYVRARDIVKGNAKLNLAFVANLFNNYPALEPVEEIELPVETREEKTYRIWLNSFGFQPTVNFLYEDLKDGLVILKVMDKIKPGIVNWKGVNKTTPMSKFKMVENCNYAVLIGKQLKFSLVGIDGTNIVDGNKTLTLAVVWQMMRFHVVSIIQSLGGDGKEIKDSDIVAWANAKVAESGKASTISSFRDSGIKQGKFLAELVHAINPEACDLSLINEGSTDDDKMLNASYVISAARKAGGTVFTLPEDIVEGKAKMVMTFVGILMSMDKKN